MSEKYSLSSSYLEAKNLAKNLTKSSGKWYPTLNITNKETISSGLQWVKENREMFKSGDWICENCKAHNFSVRNKCYKCQDFKSKWFMNQREGDWICPNCNDLVFASKSQCRKCGKGKEGHISQEEKPKKEDPEKDDSNCVVCMDAHAVVCLVTCGHIVFCEKCSKTMVENIKNCPICREDCDGSKLLRTFQV